jgi:hypothetical protein
VWVWVCPVLAGDNVGARACDEASAWGLCAVLNESHTWTADNNKVQQDSEHACVCAKVCVHLPLTYAHLKGPKPYFMSPAVLLAAGGCLTTLSRLSLTSTPSSSKWT